MRKDAEFLSTSAAAHSVGVNRSTLWRWIKLGYVQPHARTAGGHLRWDVRRLRDEVDTLRSTTPRAPRIVDRRLANLDSRAGSAPVVAAIVTSSLGVLLGRRHDGTPLWTFIAGQIEPGESAQEAAVREVREETTLAVRAGSREIGQRVHPATGRTMIYLACTPVDATDVRIGDPEELAELRWASSVDVLFELIPAGHIFAPVREHLARLLP